MYFSSGESLLIIGLFNANEYIYKNNLGLLITFSKVLNSFTNESSNTEVIKINLEIKTFKSSDNLFSLSLIQIVFNLLKHVEKTN